ncbi:MAG: 50S ribosomal protein L11 methyltransferase [Candidatus Desulforudis sp.]|nr:50S ribosomal protein L11 methyltransferase [Desulforudis sp.]
MFWLEISVITPKEYRVRVENLITGMGGSVKAPEIEDDVSGEVTVTGYFPAEAHAGDTVRLLRARIRNVLGAHPDITFAEVHGRDPETGRRRLCTTFRVGERLVVKPSWEAYESSGGEVVIDQDPTLAFGCGTHPTTALALAFLERCLQKGARVIDVGTGSGILAVAAAKLGAGEVFAVDVDPVAIEAARETVAQNNLQGRITVIEGNLLDSLTVDCDLMLANVYTHLVEELIPKAFSKVVPGGRLILTGFTAEDEGFVAGLLRGAGFDVEKVALRGRWVAMMARRPS